MSDWPVYYRERLWLGNIDKGYIGIATLWTPKEKVTKFIDEKLKEKIAVIGQLYTKRGVEYIFRNIWANPKIRYLIITGADATGSGEALSKLSFSLVKNLGIMTAIPERLVNFFVKNIKIIDMRGKKSEEIIKKAKLLKPKAPFAKKPKLFPETKPKGNNFSSENSVFRVEGETIGETWLQILNLILRFGHRVPRIHIYGGHERTLLNLAVVITDENIAKPKIWPFFEFGREQLRSYFRNFFSPDRGEESYTYGERLFAYRSNGKIVDQISRMAKKLKSFPHNKGALATLWQPQIDNFPVRKPWRTPCLTLVQGFCFDEKLYLTAYIRSNDMLGAWPQNAFALRKLQSEIAKRIGKKLGDLTIISHTAFIDDNDLARAQKIVGENQRLFCKIDPRGSLVIEVEKREIVVRHLSLGGELFAEYRQDGKEPKAALKLAQKLLADNVISRVDHALDVGEQLGRAEDAIKLRLKFEQDKQLI